MPRIHITQYDDWDEIDDEFKERERVLRRPKEEKNAPHKKGNKYNADAARRKEYVERD